MDAAAAALSIQRVWRGHRGREHARARRAGSIVSSLAVALRNTGGEGPPALWRALRRVSGQRVWERTRRVFRERHPSIDGGDLAAALQRWTLSASELRKLKLILRHRGAVLHDSDSDDELDLSRRSSGGSLLSRPSLAFLQEGRPSFSGLLIDAPVLSPVQPDAEPPTKPADAAQDSDEAAAPPEEARGTVSGRRVRAPQPAAGPSTAAGPSPAMQAAAAAKKVQRAYRLHAAAVRASVLRHRKQVADAAEEENRSAAAAYIARAWRGSHTRRVAQQQAADSAPDRVGLRALLAVSSGGPLSALLRCGLGMTPEMDAAVPLLQRCGRGLRGRLQMRSRCGGSAVSPGRQRKKVGIALDVTAAPPSSGAASPSGSLSPSSYRRQSLRTVARRVTESVRAEAVATDLAAELEVSWAPVQADAPELRDILRDAKQGLDVESPMRWPRKSPSVHSDAAASHSPTPRRGPAPPQRRGRKRSRRRRARKRKPRSKSKTPGKKRRATDMLPADVPARLKRAAPSWWHQCAQQNMPELTGPELRELVLAARQAVPTLRNYDDATCRYALKQTRLPRPLPLRRHPAPPRPRASSRSSSPLPNPFARPPPSAGAGKGWRPRIVRSLPPLEETAAAAKPAAASLPSGQHVFTPAPPSRLPQRPPPPRFRRPPEEANVGATAPRSGNRLPSLRTKAAATSLPESPVVEQLAAAATAAVPPERAAPKAPDSTAPAAPGDGEPDGPQLEPEPGQDPAKSDGTPEPASEPAPGPVPGSEATAQPEEAAPMLEEAAPEAAHEAAPVTPAVTPAEGQADPVAAPEQEAAQEAARTPEVATAPEEGHAKAAAPGPEEGHANAAAVEAAPGPEPEEASPVPEEEGAAVPEGRPAEEATRLAPEAAPPGSQEAEAEEMRTAHGESPSPEVPTSPEPVHPARTEPHGTSKVTPCIGLALLFSAAPERNRLLAAVRPVPSSVAVDGLRWLQRLCHGPGLLLLVQAREEPGRGRPPALSAASPVSDAYDDDYSDDSDDHVSVAEDSSVAYSEDTAT